MVVTGGPDLCEESEEADCAAVALDIEPVADILPNERLCVFVGASLRTGIRVGGLPRRGWSTGDKRILRFESSDVSRFRYIGTNNEVWSRTIYSYVDRSGITSNPGRG